MMTGTEDTAGLGTCNGWSTCTKCTFNDGPDAQLGGNHSNKPFVPVSGGKYVKRVTYEYVGAGNGEFDHPQEMQPVRTEAVPLRARCQTGGLFAIALLLLVLMILMIFAGSGSITPSIEEQGDSEHHHEASNHSDIDGENHTQHNHSDKGHSEEDDERPMDRVPDLQIPPEEIRAPEVTVDAAQAGQTADANAWFRQQPLTQQAVAPSREGGFAVGGVLPGGNEGAAWPDPMAAAPAAPAAAAAARGASFLHQAAA